MFINYKIQFTLCLIGVFIFNSSKSHTQEIYQTKHGLCLIKTEYKNEDIIFHSFSSSVSFQPNTAKLELILPIESLYNGNKYIETMLAKLEKGEFRLTGRLNLNEDKIVPYLIYYLTFDALFNYKDFTQELIVNGKIEYVPLNNLGAYRLNVSFIVHEFELLNEFSGKFEFHLLPSTLYTQ
jgi:hypothetical protein